MGFEANYPVQGVSGPGTAYAGMEPQTSWMNWMMAKRGRDMNAEATSQGSRQAGQFGLQQQDQAHELAMLEERARQAQMQRAEALRHPLLQELLRSSMPIVGNNIGGY